MARSKRIRPGKTTNVGSDYTPDQVEFIKALDRWMVRNHRRPEAWEVLGIAKSLGYRLRPDGN